VIDATEVQRSPACLVRIEQQDSAAELIRRARLDNALLGKRVAQLLSGDAPLLPGSRHVVTL
jgi:hypothetical protein